MVSASGSQLSVWLGWLLAEEEQVLLETEPASGKDERKQHREPECLCYLNLAAGNLLEKREGEINSHDEQDCEHKSAGPVSTIASL